MNKDKKNYIQIILWQIIKCSLNVIELGFHILYYNRKAIEKVAVNLEIYRMSFSSYLLVYPTNI